MGSWRSVRELPIRARGSRNARERGFFRVWFLLMSREFILCGLAFGLQPVILIFYFLFFYFFSNSISQDPPVVRHILRDSLPGTHLVPYHLNLQYSGPVAPWELMEEGPNQPGP